MQRPAFRVLALRSYRIAVETRGVHKAAFNSRRSQRTHAKLFYARHCNWLAGAGAGGQEGEGARDCRVSGTEGSLYADARGRVNNVSRL